MFVTAQELDRAGSAQLRAVFFVTGASSVA
jgi:hypothetical protein